jgi:hypothetical protein
MNKPILFLVALLIIASFILGGCSSTPEPTTTAAQTTPPPSTTSPPAPTPSSTSTPATSPTLTPAQTPSFTPVETSPIIPEPPAGTPSQVTHVIVKVNHQTIQELSLLDSHIVFFTAKINPINTLSGLTHDEVALYIPANQIDAVFNFIEKCVFSPVVPIGWGEPSFLGETPTRFYITWYWEDFYNHLFESGGIRIFFEEE